MAVGWLRGTRYMDASGGLLAMRGFMQISIGGQLDEHARRRSIAFLNWAHAIDHFVLLIYPTVVIGLEAVDQCSYSGLIALSSTAFVAFGFFSLPAGWLADRWSRRNMMAALYICCGLSLAFPGLGSHLATLGGR